LDIPLIRRSTRGKSDALRWAFKWLFCCLEITIAFIIYIGLLTDSEAIAKQLSTDAKK